MIISNVKVVDVERGQVSDSQHVLIKGTRIAELLTAARPPAHDQPQIDGHGQYLAPGLINVHEHLTYKNIVGTWDLVMGPPAEVQMLRGVRAALYNFEHGVTTIRDLGAKGSGNLLLRDAIRQGLMPGPKMQASGSPIARTGGHAWQMCIEADGPERMAQAVRQLIKQGVDWIKIMASGGALPGHTFESASRPHLTDQEMRAAVGEANRLGVPSTVHAIGAQAIRQSVEAGVASVEHGAGLDEPTIDLMLKRGVWFVPTLSVYYQSVAEHVRWGRSGATLAASQALYERHGEGMRMAVKARLPMAAGTDSIGDMVEEMRLLGEFGMDAAEVVRTATLNGAKLMGMGQLTGSVAVGKLADLVLLPDNPLVNPTAYAQPQLVWADGQMVYDKEGGIRVAVHY